MPGRTLGIGVLALVICAFVSSARAEPTFERIEVGAAYASPFPALSLFGKLDDRWSGTASLGLFAEVRANYTREESRGAYWTGGVGLSHGLGVVRAGYGRAWRRGPWRWHLEATLNVPFPIGGSSGEGDLATAVVAAYTFLVPIGFGVHYVFGER